MSYLPSKGDCILIPFNDVKHLFFVLNSPCRDGLCALVMLSSVKVGRFYDNSCVFKGGEHPFIKHPCYVVYRLTEYRKAQHISKMVDSGIFEIHVPADPLIMDRVIEGFYKSEETKQYMLNYAREVNLK